MKGHESGLLLDQKAMGYYFGTADLTIVRSAAAGLRQEVRLCFGLKSTTETQRNSLAWAGGANATTTILKQTLQWDKCCILSASLL
jgi:hypothetical protein